MPANLYLGPTLEYSKSPHKKDFHNSAISVFRPQGNSLSITITVRNSGDDAENVGLNLYALCFDSDGCIIRPDHKDETANDNLAIVAMASQPVRQWLGHFVPGQDHFMPWTTGAFIYQLPRGTAAFLLVAKVFTPGEPLPPENLPPSENSHIAIWSDNGSNRHHRMDP